MVKNQKGLTLVELLAVIVILGIIAVIVVPAIGNIIENSEKDAAIANAVQVINSAKLAVTSGSQKSVISTANDVKDFIDPFVNPFTKEQIGLSNISISWDSSEPKVNLTQFGCGTGSDSAATLDKLTGKDARTLCKS